MGGRQGIWSFCYAKDKNLPTAKAAPEGAGSVWTWTALDSTSKLLVSYLVGDRSGQSAIAVMDDLCFRAANRFQLTSDGHRVYLDAVEGAFGGDIDYAMLIKLYGPSPNTTETRYSPAECIGAKTERVEGSPDMTQVSTSHVERSNLSLRMHMRRFTRLTNAHCKKFMDYVYMVALYTVFYNFIRQHNSLSGATPAMAAGLAPSFLSFEDIIARIDAKQAPKPRGPYRPRQPKNSN